MKTPIVPCAVACNNPLILTGAVVVLVFLASHTTRAADGVWDMDADGAWDTAADPPWSGSVVPGAISNTLNPDLATFGFTLTADRVVTVDAGRNIKTITFANPSPYKYTLAGGPLLLTSGGIMQTGAANGNHIDTISSAIEIQGTTAAAASFTANAASATSLLSVGAVTGVSESGNTTVLTLSGTNPGANRVSDVIGDGAGGGKLAITKSQAGQWIVAGANTYTGVTTVSGGVLRLNHATAIPGGIASSGGTNNLTFSGGVIGLGSDDFTRSLDTAATPTAATFIGAGGWAAYTADRVVNLGGAAALITWATANTGFNGQTLILGAATADKSVDFQNPIDLTTSARTVQVENGSADMDAKLSGIISGGAGGALTKTGTGTLAVSGANTYTGGTTVNAGTLTFLNTATKPATGTVNVAALATLGLGVGGTGGFTSANVDALFANTLTGVTMNATSIAGIDTTAGDFTYASSPGAARALTKLGANTLTLSGAASYTGQTTVSGGTLKLGAAGSGANSPLGTIAAGTVVNAGAALDLGGFSLAIAEALTLNGNGISNGGALVNSSTGAANYPGVVTIGSGGASIGGTGNITLTAALANTANKLTKVGATSTLTLNTLSSRTGPLTISEGTLKVAANGAMGTAVTTVTVSTGAALDLNGASYTMASPLTLHGTGITGGGALANSSVNAASYGGPLTLAGDTSVVANSGSINLSNTISGSGVGLTLDGTNTSSKVSGNIATAAGGLSKTGAGTWELAGTNTYSGPTNVTNGVLKVTKPASLYNAVETDWTPAHITVAGGATLRIAVGTASDFTSAQVGTLLTHLTTVNFNGLQNGAFLGLDTFSNVAGVTTISAILPNSSGPGGGVLGLRKFSGGTVLLSGANTYSGKTVIEVGSLKVASINSVATNPALGTVHSASSNLGSPNTADYGTIDFGIGSSPALAGLIYTGTGETTDRVMNIAAKSASGQGGITFDQSGSGLLKFMNPFTMTGSGNMIIILKGDTGAGEIVGALVNPSGFTTTLTKSGAGTWTLSGANSHTGNTTVTAGTLVLADHAQLKFVIGATSGITNNISGAGAAILNGDFSIDTTAAAALTSGTWNLVSTTTKSFTSSFTVIGFIPNEDGITWFQSVSGGKTWIFDESTGVLTLITSTDSDYDTWMAFYPSITNPLDKLPAADPDHDGLTNQQEYAFGLNPSSGASSSPITEPLNKTTGIFKYTRRATPAITGLNYSVYTSTSLAGWALDAAAVQTVTGTTGNVQTVQVTLTGTKPLALPKLFVRVKAQ